MEKKQYELCLEILRRFNQRKLLGNVVLIGSWCMVFYEEYFHPTIKERFGTFKTRDIDFLIPAPSKISQKTDVPALVRDLGFVTSIGGSKGIVRLIHPDLILEFLVPERGKGSEKPVDLPQLGMNAVALRFLNFLTDNIIPVKVEDFFVYLPHPVNFSLHKLIVSQRRHNKEKSSKDRQMGVQLLNLLIKKGNAPAIKKVFGDLPPKWRGIIAKALDPIEDREILVILK